MRKMLYCLLIALAGIAAAAAVFLIVPIACTLVIWLVGMPFHTAHEAAWAQSAWSFVPAHYTQGKHMFLGLSSLFWYAVSISIIAGPGFINWTLRQTNSNTTESDVILTLLIALGMFAVLPAVALM